jgi:serine/threonine protein kinase
MYQAPELVKLNTTEGLCLISLIYLFFLRARTEYRFQYDIWSVAIILFELLELKRPFEEKSLYQIMEDVSQKKLRPLTRKTPEVLVSIYNSIISAVRYLFFSFIIFVINVIVFIIYYYLFLFIIITIIYIRTHSFALMC